MTADVQNALAAHELHTEDLCDCFDLLARRVAELERHSAAAGQDATYFRKRMVTAETRVAELEAENERLRANQRTGRIIHGDALASPEASRFTEGEAGDGGGA